MRRAKHCIYCRVPVDGRGQGDHVIPDRFGKFRNYLRLMQICPACNSRIGAHEEELIRCGPESICLQAVRPTAGRRTGGARKWVGTRNVQPPRAVHVRDDHEERVEIVAEQGQFIRKYEHIDVVPERGEAKVIRLVPQMSARQLRERVEALDVGAIRRMHLHAEASNWALYRLLVREAWPKSDLVEGEPTGVGHYRILVRHECRVTNAYWQAIAKIAFHYFLVANRRGYLGDEDDFAAIRGFIRDGVGAAEQFFVNGLTRFQLPQLLTGSDGVRLEEWNHVLMLDESDELARVGVGLFLGPGGECAALHRLTLARFRSNLIVPDLRRFHRYLYFSEPDEGGNAGEVVEDSDFKLRAMTATPSPSPPQSPPWAGAE